MPSRKVTAREEAEYQAFLREEREWEDLQDRIAEDQARWDEDADDN